MPLSVRSLTFPSTSAKVTIVGTGCITNATTIVNESSERHDIGVPVEFVASGAYAPIDVTGEVEFSGGVKGTVPESHTTFYGDYTLTATEWTLSSAITLAENATVTATDMVMHPNKQLLNAETGSKLTLNQLYFDKYINGNVFGTYNGELDVDTFYTYYPKSSISFNSGFAGLLRIGYFHNHTAGLRNNVNFTPAPSATIVVGGTGFDSQTGWLRLGSFVARSSGDWTIKLTKNNFTYSDVSQSVEINSGSFDVDTSDYDNPSAAGHIVTVVNKETKYAESADNLLKGDGAMSAFGKGTLKFESSANFTGGFTASNGVTVAVCKDAYPGKGDVTIKDTATLDLVQSSSGAVPVAGTLTMAAGATLRIPELADGVLPLSVNALAFDGVTGGSKVALDIAGGSLASGFNAIIQSATELPANAWDSFDLTLGATVPSGMTPIYTVQDNTMYIVLNGENDAVWTGGGGDAKFSTGANWLAGEVPADGASVHIMVESEATLVNDIPGFSPASIIFPAGSAAVTIAGAEAIAGVAEVRNLSSAVQEIACPLEFADSYRVHCTSQPVNFSGGATATYPASDMTDNAASHTLMGDITFTADWNCNYSISETYSVPSGSRLYGQSLTGTKTQIVLTVEEGGYAEFAGNVYTGPNCGRVSVKGEIVVGGDWIVKNTGAIGHVGYDGDEKGNGVIRAKGIWKGSDGDDMNRAVYVKPRTIYIGSDGLGAKKKDYAIHFDAVPHTVYATDDFEVFGVKNTGNLSDWGVMLDTETTFDTQGHTITWTGGAEGAGAFIKAGEGKLVFNPYGVGWTNTVRVAGGTLVCAMSAGVGSGAITVKANATLAVGDGAKTGTGAVTVENGGTLAVAESGTGTLGGSLTLESGAALGFNWSGAATPVLDLTGKTVTIAEGAAVSVKVSVDPGVCLATGRARVLTSGGNFAGKTVTLAEGSPEWARSVRVNADGNIELETVRGLRIMLR